MPNVTIASTTTELKWQGGAAPTFIVEAAGPTLTPEGVPVINGGGPFRNEWAATVNGGGYVVVPQITLPSGVTYFAYFQKANVSDSSSRYPFSVFGPQNPFYVPEDTPTTWEDLALNPSPSGPATPADRIVNNLSVLANAEIEGALTAPSISGPTEFDDNVSVVGNVSVAGALTAGDLSGASGLPGTPSGPAYESLEDDASAWVRYQADNGGIGDFRILRGSGGSTQTVFRLDEQGVAHFLNRPSPSAVMLYASANGAALDHNIIAETGTDDAVAIQALFDKAPLFGSASVMIDGPCLSSPLNINGNTRLEMLPGCYIYLADGSNRALLRNANPIGSGAVTDKNISLVNCTFYGNCANQAGGGLFNRREVDGTLIGLVQFYGVDNVRVTNCNFINSKSIALHFSNATNFWVTDCYIDNNVTGEFQQGGCQVEGPASNFTIRGLKGSTQDDLVGIASNDNVYVEGPFTGLGPYVAGGPITDWKVLDIEGVGETLSAVRLFNPGASADRIDRGLIDGVTGTFTLAVLWNEPGGVYDPAHGNIGTVILKNVNVHMLDTVLPVIPGGRGGVMLYNSIDNLILENLNFNDPEDSRGHLYIDGDADVKYLEIDGFKVNDTVDNASTVMFYLDGGARLRHGNFRNLVWKRGASHARATTLLYVNAGCTVDELFIDGVNANRVNAIIQRDTATTTARLTLRNVCHLDAASNLNMTVSNTLGTISVLDMSGWYSDVAGRLYNAGTITAKRGDAFISFGTCTLVAGVATVTYLETTAATKVLVNRLTDSGTIGASYSVSRSVGASITITSKTSAGATQTADTSTVAYQITDY